MGRSIYDGELTDERKANIQKRCNRIMTAAIEMSEWARKNCTNGYHLSVVEDMQLHYQGYQEPGYTDPECGIIATGNWNSISKYNAITHRNVATIKSDLHRAYGIDADKVSSWGRLNDAITIERPLTATQRDQLNRLPARISDLFEKMGIECEWGDEWIECQECGGLVRTSGDSYSWVQSGRILNECEFYCHTCIKKDPESYLESLVGSHDNAETLHIDLSEHGFVKFNEEEYAAGWYEGCNDNPKKIAAHLRDDMNIERFIFQVSEVQQFQTKFDVWVDKDELETWKKGSEDNSNNEEEEESLNA